jgi:hypothetical protein
VKPGKALAAVRPEGWRSDADPFWVIMGGGNGVCDVVIDVFKDEAKIGFTLRIKLNDPSVPAPFLEFQVMAHDLRAFAQFVHKRVSQVQPLEGAPHRYYPQKTG